MYEVINKKRYNTETSEILYERSSGAGRRDFRWFEEALYKTKSGAYFLAGRGGPASGYAEACSSGGWNSGSKITPLDKNEASAWVENAGAYGLFESEFAGMIQDA